MVRPYATRCPPVRHGDVRQANGNRLAYASLSSADVYAFLKWSNPRGSTGASPVGVLSTSP
jgi:hypothetical protein